MTARKRIVLGLGAGEDASRHAAAVSGIARQLERDLHCLIVDQEAVMSFAREGELAVFAHRLSPRWATSLRPGIARMGGNIDWTTEKAVGDVLSAMCERTEPGDIVLISSASINLTQPNALEQLNTLLQRADAVALGSDKFFFPPHAFLVEPLAALSALTPSIAHLLSSHAVSSMSLAGIEWLGRKMSPAVLVAAIENLDESSWSVLLKAAAWKPNVLILTSQDRRT